MTVTDVILTMTKPTSVTDSNRPRRMIVLVGAFLVMSVTAATVVRADRGAKPGKATARLQAGAAQAPPIHDDAELAKVGEETTQKTCDTTCHGLEKLDEQRRTAREWNEVMADMRARGAMVDRFEVASPWGHDSFLMDVPEYHAHVRDFLYQNGVGAL